MNVNVRATKTLQDGEVVFSGDSNSLTELGRWLEGGGDGRVIVPALPDGIYEVNLKEVRFDVDFALPYRKINLSILDGVLIFEVGSVVAKTLGESLQDFFSEPVERLSHFHLDCFDDFYMAESSVTLTFAYL